MSYASQQAFRKKQAIKAFRDNNKSIVVDKTVQASKGQLSENQAKAVLARQEKLTSSTNKNTDPEVLQVVENSNGLLSYTQAKKIIARNARRK